MSAPSPTDQRTPEFRSTLCAAAALAVVAGFEWHRGREGGLAVAQLYGALAVWTFVAAFISYRWPHRVSRVISHFNAFTCGVALVAAAALTGGRFSDYFAYAYALPMAFGVLAPRRPWMGAACAIGSTLAAIPVLHTSTGLDTLLTSELLILSSGVFSVVGTHLYRRLAEAEAASSEAREHALSLLAQSEKARASQERYASIGRLAAGVGHEINNPLAFVKSNLKYLAEELSNEEFDRAELTSVMTETQIGIERITRIVADLKTLSRESRDVAEPLDIRALVAEAVRVGSVRLDAVATVEVDVQNPARPVVGNSGRVVQVLLNLLVNAADALADRASARKVKISSESSDGRYCVHVDDNGSGVAEDLRERIFEPFFTCKPVGGGTGLGLAVSRSYLEQFGGGLTLGTSPLGGARFTLALAYAQATLPALIPSAS